MVDLYMQVAVVRSPQVSGQKARDISSRAISMWSNHRVTIRDSTISQLDFFGEQIRVRVVLVRIRVR